MTKFDHFIEGMSEIPKIRKRKAISSKQVSKRLFLGVP